MVDALFRLIDINIGFVAGAGFYIRLHAICSEEIQKILFITK